MISISDQVCLLELLPPNLRFVRRPVEKVTCPVVKRRLFNPILIDLRVDVSVCWETRIKIDRHRFDRQDFDRLLGHLWGSIVAGL